MNNVKSIYDNSVGKEVKMIQDSNGNIIWYKVPDGYRKVDWLGTDGYAYIDTGIKPTTRDKHEAVFDCQFSTSTGQILFGSTLGAWNDSVSNWFLFRPAQNNSNQINMWYRFTGYLPSHIYTGTGFFIPGTKQHLYIEQISNTIKFRLNNSSLLSLLTRDAEIETEQPTYRLLRYQMSDESLKLQNTMKIYSYKFSQEGVCVRHFIPVVRTSDNKPGMYDLVNDVFYTNAGAGEFTWGEL